MKPNTLKVKTFTLDRVYNYLAVTRSFDDKEKFKKYSFKLDFGLQETLFGNVLLAVNDISICTSDYIEGDPEYLLKIVENFVAEKSFIGHKVIEIWGHNKNYMGKQLELLYNDDDVETYDLTAWARSNLLFVRNELLRIMNYGNDFDPIF